jgi:hypothetical protein
MRKLYIIDGHRTELLVDADGNPKRPLFDLLPSIKFNDETDMRILQKWMDDFRRCGVPFLVEKVSKFKCRLWKQLR